MSAQVAFRATAEIYLGEGTKDDTWTNGGSFTVNKDFANAINDMIDAVNAGIPFDDINNIVAQVQTTINRVNNTLDRAANFEARVTNYLEYLIQRALNNVNRALEPILLVDGSNGMQRATATYKAGKHTFVPTSVTYELVAPAFKKYIAVLKDGKVVSGKQWTLTKGEDRMDKIDIELAEGENQIVYAAMDFRGYQIAKVYNITVEK